MKKKIAVVFDHLIVGGAERSLIQFLRAIDPDRYDITLFTRTANNIYAKEIPDRIRIWPTADMIQDPRTLLLDDLKHARIFQLIRSLWLRVLLRIRKHPYEKLLITHRIQREVPELFDLAIAYKLNYDDTAFTLGRLRARKKCAWVHSIVSYDGKDACVYKSARAFQKIYCVSRFAMAQFQKTYPYLAKKADVIHNLIDAPAILEKAAEPFSPPLRAPALVTVGRLSDEKGQVMIPQIARKLIDSGHLIYWYLIGDGPARPQILENIRRYGVEDHVFLLGARENPYPHMQACQIYVQTSYSEGWCLTTQEARILCKPVVTTGIPVMEEQFAHGKDGSIAKDTTPEAIAAEILELLDHPALPQGYIDALKVASHGYPDELQKLYDFIEDQGA